MRKLSCSVNHSVHDTRRAYLRNPRGFQDGFLTHHLWDVDEPHAFQVVLVLPPPVQAVVHQAGNVLENIGAQFQLQGAEVMEISY